MKKLLSSAAFLAALLISHHAQASTYYVTTSQGGQDTYVSSGEPDTSFGSKGAMMIAVPTSSQNRTEEALIQYNTASIKSSLDAEYGVGGWTVTSVTLTFYSNFSTAGVQPGNSSFNKIAAGEFNLSWISSDDWNQNSVTWNNLATSLGSYTSESLGDYSYSATGATSDVWTLTLSSGLLSDILSGSKVSIFGTPTANSTVGYLFNTTNNGPSVFTVTAVAAPEPSTCALLIFGVMSFCVLSRRRSRS
jgi:hypothetical protein